MEQPSFTINANLAVHMSLSCFNEIQEIGKKSKMDASKKVLKIAFSFATFNPF